MKYRVIDTDTKSLLEDRVAQYISEGWVPQGGVCVSEIYDQVRYIQAMIKNTIDE